MENDQEYQRLVSMLPAIGTKIKFYTEGRIDHDGKLVNFGLTGILVSSGLDHYFYPWHVITLVSFERKPTR